MKFNYLNQIKAILNKDILIESSYKVRFLYSVLFIFLQLTVFIFYHFLLKVLSLNLNNNIESLFGFFLLEYVF